jgi:hypothetical protein
MGKCAIYLGASGAPNVCRIDHDEHRCTSRDRCASRRVSCAVRSSPRNRLSKESFDSCTDGNIVSTARPSGNTTHRARRLEVIPMPRSENVNAELRPGGDTRRSDVVLTRCDSSRYAADSANGAVMTKRWMRCNSTIAMGRTSCSRSAPAFAAGRVYWKSRRNALCSARTAIVSRT